MNVSDEMAESIRFRATVMPFAALGLGSLIGYVWAKPYLDTARSLKAYVDRLAPLLGVKGAVGDVMNYLPVDPVAPISGNVLLPEAPPIVGTEVALGGISGLSGVTDLLFGAPSIDSRGEGLIHGGLWGLGGVSCLAAGAYLPAGIPYLSGLAKAGAFLAGGWMFYKSARSFLASATDESLPPLVTPSVSSALEQAEWLLYAFARAKYIDQATLDIVKSKLSAEYELAARGGRDPNDPDWLDMMSYYELIVQNVNDGHWALLPNYWYGYPDPRDLYPTLDAARQGVTT